MSSALLTLYRSLANHRLFAVLNIGGLALGIAVFLVLSLFVRFETSWDRWFPGGDTLWVMEQRYHLAGTPDAPNPNVMGGELELLRADYPGVVGTRFLDMGAIVRQGDTATGTGFFVADANFFQLFPYPVIAGDPTRTLADPNGLIIDQTRAKQFFGDQPPIGRTLTITVGNGTYVYRVGAVLRDAPPNANFPMRLAARLVRERYADANWYIWGNGWLRTVLRFPDDAAAKAFEAGPLRDFVDRRAFADGRLRRGDYSQTLRRLPELHLAFPSYRIAVATMGSLGLLILLIAVVNYINLVTARAGLRAREVAMRKVLGATQAMLVRQFLGEAILMVAIAALAGLALAEIALPFVNAAGGTTLAISYFGDDGIVLPMIALVVVVGIVAGLYPAMLLARFRPAAVLASARAPGGGRAGIRLRQALVVFQFGIATAFGIATVVMIAQGVHTNAADLGFRRDGLVLVSSVTSSAIEPAQRRQLIAAFAHVPGVESIGFGDDAPAEQHVFNRNGVYRPATPGTRPAAMILSVGPGYFATLRARMLAGRAFDARHAADDLALRKAGGASATNVILNRSLLGELGFTDPAAAIGQTLLGDRPMTIVGVIEDMRFRGPRNPVGGVLYRYDTEPSPTSIVTIRYRGADQATMIARLGAVWKRIAPAVPYEATGGYDNIRYYYHKSDDQLARLFTIGAVLAVLAVLIGCVGLYGLTAFDTARRVKEIGIRKTLGASTADVLRLLIGQFLRPVLFANLIAWPLAFVMLQRWLAQFDDRVALSPMIFVGASVAAMGIATATVFAQAWRVARAEPARALRHE